MVWIPPSMASVHGFIGRHSLSQKLWGLVLAASLHPRAISQLCCALALPMATLHLPICAPLYRPYPHHCGKTRVTGACLESNQLSFYRHPWCMAMLVPLDSLSCQIRGKVLPLYLSLSSNPITIVANCGCFESL